MPWVVFLFRAGAAAVRVVPVVLRKARLLLVRRARVGLDGRVIAARVHVQLHGLGHAPMVPLTRLDQDLLLLLAQVACPDLLKAHRGYVSGGEKCVFVYIYVCVIITIVILSSNVTTPSSCSGSLK